MGEGVVQSLDAGGEFAEQTNTTRRADGVGVVAATIGFSQARVRYVRGPSPSERRLRIAPARPNAPRWWAGRFDDRPVLAANSVGGRYPSASASTIMSLWGSARAACTFSRDISIKAEANITQSSESRQRRESAQRSESAERPASVAPVDAGESRSPPREGRR